MCMHTYLDLLRVDIRNSRCLAGRCRLKEEALLELSYGRKYGEPGSQWLAVPPKRLEIVGALKSEEAHFRRVLTRMGKVPDDRISFLTEEEYIDNVAA